MSEPLDMSAFEAPTMATRHFAEELHLWLDSKADHGTSIDSGGGFGCRDLWVTVGGRNFFISVTDKGPSKSAEH